MVMVNSPLMFQIKECVREQVGGDPVLAAQFHWANRGMSFISELYHVQQCTIIKCSEPSCGFQSIRCDDPNHEVSLYIPNKDVCTLEVS